MEYPYQLTAFLSNEPRHNEPVYKGENGWYPQIALKRRFKIVGIDENEFFRRLESYCKTYDSFTVTTGELVKPGRMPVEVVTVEASPELMNFHREFITMMANSMESRYPERDNENYLPHITAEYDGEYVIDTGDFTNKQFSIDRIWVLKDVDNENSVAYKSFELG